MMRVIVVMMRMLSVVVMMVGCVGPGGAFADVEFGRRDTRAQHLLAGDCPAVDRQTAERCAQILWRQPEIEQRADDHVARGAGETVEIERFRQTLNTCRVRGSCSTSRPPAPRDR